MLRTESVPKSIPTTQAPPLIASRPPPMTDGRTASRWSTLLGTVAAAWKLLENCGSGSGGPRCLNRIVFPNHIAAGRAPTLVYHDASRNAPGPAVRAARAAVPTGRGLTPSAAGPADSKIHVGPRPFDRRRTAVASSARAFRSRAYVPNLLIASLREIS